MDVERDVCDQSGHCGDRAGHLTMVTTNERRLVNKDSVLVQVGAMAVAPTRSRLLILLGLGTVCRWVQMDANRCRWQGICLC
jgi:hypothetical protein